MLETISEPILRLSVFAAAFIVMALLELALPKRRERASPHEAPIFVSTGGVARCPKCECNRDSVRGLVRGGPSSYLSLRTRAY